jgi:hypothetical protein
VRGHTTLLVNSYTLKMATMYHIEDVHLHKDPGLVKIV